MRNSGWKTQTVTNSGIPLTDIMQSPPFRPIKMLKVFSCSDLFQKAGSGEKRRENFKTQMTVGIRLRGNQSNSHMLEA